MEQTGARATTRRTRRSGCCDSPVQVIDVQVGAQAAPDDGLELHRCAGCGAQAWARAGVTLDRTEAFSLLAQAYREVPLRAHAARDRTLAAAAARQAARLAAQAGKRAGELASKQASKQAQAHEGSSHGGGPESTPEQGRGAAELREMLAGWQVLGAAS